MNIQKPIKLAIISDLHCHGIDEYPERKAESYFLAGQPRFPSERNPLQSLLETIRRERITCDYLVVPGDISNNFSKIGLTTGWYGIKEVEKELKAKLIVATIGNHDIDSHSSSGLEIYEHTKYFAENFPSNRAEENDSFWHNGFAVLDQPDARFTIINSCIDHYDSNSSRKGSFPEHKINLLDKRLSSLPASEIHIAVLHHHPIPHQGTANEHNEQIPTGKSLVDVLTKHNCRLIIHGHRHIPEVSKIESNGSSHVFGAGSFSKVLIEMGSITRNLFHIVVAESNLTRGWINSWEYNISAGWVRSTKNSSTLPFHCGFGIDKTHINTLITKLHEIFQQSDSEVVSAKIILEKVPELFYITPETILELSSKLKKEYGLKPVFEDDGTFSFIAKVSN